MLNPIIQMQKIVFGIFILLMPAIGSAQDSTSAQKKASLRKYRKALNKQQINQLHDGVLLVRLKTKKNSIDFLKETEKNKLAEKIELRQAEINKEIINAFGAYFDFCPVYFFFSDYSQNIIDRQFDKVEFLNRNLLPYTSAMSGFKSFLTAEFGIIQQDTSKYFDADFYARGENGREKRKSYHGGPDMRFSAFVIKSDKFIQLRRPFPYYVPTFDTFNKRRLKKVVQKMNKNLHKFFKKNNT